MRTNPEWDFINQNFLMRLKPQPSRNPVLETRRHEVRIADELTTESDYGGSKHGRGWRFGQNSWCKWSFPLYYWSKTGFTMCAFFWPYAPTGTGKTVAKLQNDVLFDQDLTILYSDAVVQYNFLIGTDPIGVIQHTVPTQKHWIASSVHMTNGLMVATTIVPELAFEQSSFVLRGKSMEISTTSLELALAPGQAKFDPKHHLGEFFITRGRMNIKQIRKWSRSPLAYARPWWLLQQVPAVICPVGDAGVAPAVLGQPDISLMTQGEFDATPAVVATSDVGPTHTGDFDVVPSVEGTFDLCEGEDGSN
jgi:hypothetical protein